MNPSTMIVFPHQLFETLPNHIQRVYVIEDPLFFYDTNVQIRFHKQKLLLHRASMHAYTQKLRKRGYTVHYIAYADANLMDVFALIGEAQVMIWDVVDDYLSRRIHFAAQKQKITVKWEKTPMFLLDNDALNTYFENNDFYMHQFYVHQRKKYGILMENGKPLGERYSFDVFNRKKLPKNISVPPYKKFFNHDLITRVKPSIDKEFPDHPGCMDAFDYPLTRAEALKALDDFLDHRFDAYGPYQDAIDSFQSVLFHSRLSSSLNIGLITPSDVVAKTLERNVAIASKEGFLRQIIGWREFMRATYVLKGRYMRTKNYLNHTRDLPQWFEAGKSGLAPLDNVVKRLHKTAYSNHIERLMILGNMTMLLRIHPDEVYRFFMTYHIDAYDWVMVPNVYAMSQYASGPLLTTKPYFSGSNYILKMSDYGKGTWSQHWDALFYLFLRDNQDWLSNNPRLRMLMGHLKKKDASTIQAYETMASPYLND